MISVKSQKEIQKMRAAGIIAAEVLEILEKSVVPGVTTAELDRIAHDYIVSHKATPSFLNYRGFPGSVCTSVNDVIIHGIPSKKKVLREGDILSCDIVAELDGYMGDNTKTFMVGEVSEEAVEQIAGGKVGKGGFGFIF